MLFLPVISARLSKERLRWKGVSSGTDTQWCYSFLKLLLTNRTLLRLSKPSSTTARRTMNNGNFSSYSREILIAKPRCTPLAQFFSPWSPEGLSASLRQEKAGLDSSPCWENVFWKPQVNSYFNFPFIAPFASSLSTVSEILITVKVTDKTPSNCEPEWSQDFTLYKLNFSHCGPYLLLLSGITPFDYGQSTTSCSLQL